MLDFIYFLLLLFCIFIARFENIAMQSDGILSNLKPLVRSTDEAEPEPPE